MALRIYTDKDVDLRWLKGKTRAVVGFGAQSRAHALNLKDSGINVMSDCRTGRRSQNLMREATNHPIESVGRRLRALMSWRKKTKTR